MQYKGTGPEVFHCAISLSSSTPTAADNFEMALSTTASGTPVPYTGSVFAKDFAANNIISTTASHKLVTLNTNDVLYVIMRDISSAGKTHTSNNLNVVVVACCSK